MSVAEEVRPVASLGGPAALGKPFGLYVHIPFCERKCFYCDFNSGFHGPETRERYVDALLREIRATPFSGTAARSVFFGGGTPSVLPASAIAAILDALRERFAFLPTAEITVECNPGTIASERMADETTAGFLNGLSEAGVNRLSFGVQSFDAGILQRLGRIHSPEQAEISVRAAQAAGITNINVDLMFALPGQTMDLWNASLDRALALDVPHLSCYSLIVEPETPFAMWDAQKRLPRPGEDDEAAMYETVMTRLGDAGYEQYEVSAFAKPGHRSVHNTVYWRNEEYVGFGNGATSYVDGERFSREPSLDAYIEKAAGGTDTVTERERLDRAGQMSETMMMGLRLVDGIDRAAFEERFGVDPVAFFSEPVSRFTASGLLEATDERVALTHRGFFLANEVWEAFV